MRFFKFSGGEGGPKATVTSPEELGRKLQEQKKRCVDGAREENGGIGPKRDNGRVLFKHVSDEGKVSLREKENIGV